MRIGQEFTIQRFLAGRRVAGKRHAGAAIIAHVAEHHRLYIHGGAQIMRNTVQVAVHDRSLIVPGTEYRFHRHEQLLHWILREGSARTVNHQFFISGDQLAKRLSRQFLVKLHALLFFAFGQQFFKIMLVDFEHYIAEHLNETAISVKSEAAVGCSRCHPFDRDIVQTKIQNRIHHAWHRKNRAGPNRQQQWIGRIAEFFIGFLFNRRQAGFHLVS